jgi:curved DNA-binding protein CbpA
MVHPGSGAYDHPMADPYEVLQVHPRADPDVVRAAYRTLARKYHPDFGGDPKRMMALNEAWAILGDPDRRTEHDRTSATRPAPSVVTTPPPPPPPVDITGVPEPPPRPRTGGNRWGTVLDFGRYSGWSIGELVEQDPEYLEWLSRTPIGRAHRAEIDRALSQRDAVATALRPAPTPTPRGRRFRR